MKKHFFLFILICCFNELYSQRMLGDVLDSAALSQRQLKLLNDKYGNLSFSGYIQPQYQFAEEKGTQSEYQGGVFAENSDNRFRLRRGRLRADYVYNYSNGLPSTYFVFQFDGTEQGVNIRDFWGRYYENKWNLFYVTAGMMVRPFGYELQLSSSARESSERGRMSQILMKTERDLGIMVSLNKRTSTNIVKNFRFDLGIFNGQGLSGPREYDNKKDIVSRFSLNPLTIDNVGTISGGVSVLAGGIVSESPITYKMENKNATWKMIKDSASVNFGKMKSREYYGADVSYTTLNKKWQTMFRAEYLQGLQTATLKSSATPGTYPMENNIKGPLVTRPFNGAYFYFMQDIGSPKNEVIVKYDFYDPNTHVKGMEIAEADGFTEADIRYNTLGFGFLHHVNSHLKLLAWYDHIKNENTHIKGFEEDVNDNILTLRAQFIF